MGLQEVAIVEEQLDRLEARLVNDPSLSVVLQQGEPLDWYLSAEGVAEVRAAALSDSLDPVALRHGIKRIRRRGYESEVIWDADIPKQQTVHDDRIIERLESAFAVIRAEVANVLSSQTLFPDSDALTNENGAWLYLPFFADAAPVNMQAECPMTAQLLQELDPPLNLELGFAFVSTLTGKTVIAAHRGSSSLRQRYHLGLFVPEPGVSRIRIEDQWIEWQEGVAFGFNDSFEHEVENAGSGNRVVLIVDVWPKGVPSRTVQSLRKDPSIFEFLVLKRTGQTVALND